MEMLLTDNVGFNRQYLLEWNYQTLMMTLKQNWNYNNIG